MDTKFNISFWIIALAVTAAWHPGNRAVAQVVDWTNVSNSNSYWHLRSNWSTSTVPGSTEVARFNANREYDVWWNASTGDRDVGFLSVTDGAITFENQSSFSHELLINGSSGGSLSDFSIAGSSTTLTNRGINLRSQGGAQIIGGATLTLDGSHAAGARLTVESTSFESGLNVSGTLAVHSGAIVTNHYARVGWASGSNGTATVSGLGSQWNNRSLYVGSEGSGTLNVQSEGVVTSDYGMVSYLGNSVGEANIVGQGSRWDNVYNLFVGRNHNSNGTLNVENSGAVSSGTVLIGFEPGSTGTVNVAGKEPAGSSARLNFNRIEVGNSGNGTLDIGENGLASGQFGYVGLKNGSTGSVHVGGTDAQWTLSNRLAVGGDNDAQGGSGELNIDTGGTVSVGGTTRIWSTGIVNLNGGRFEFGETTFAELSRINAVSGSMAGNLQNVSFTDAGSLSSLQNDNVDLTDVQVTNSGTLFGNALLGNSLLNLAGGEVQAVAGERLRFAGSGTNAGEINNFGGTLLFGQELTNTSSGFVSGRGVLGASGGWINQGVMAFSGDTDVTGDLENVVGGQIVTSGGATTTFFDDVIHNGTEIRTAAGSTTVFFGAVGGSGSFTGTGTVFFEGDLRPGNSPDIVDFEGDVVLGSNAVSFIELGGLEPGEFDQLNVDGDLFIDGELVVDLIDGFQLSWNQEFLIFGVEQDLAGQFSLLNEGAVVGHFGGQNLFITYAAGDGNDIALFTAVPEPGAGLLFVLGWWVALFGYRRRSASGQPLVRETGTA